MSGATINAGAAGTITIPSSTATNLLFLQLAIAQLGSGSIFGQALTDGETAPSVPAGQNGVAVLAGGGSATIPTGYGIVALTGSTAATITGGDAGPGGTAILSGLGGLTYNGGAPSIIATGGNNVITATVAGAFPGQFIDVGGSSTVTANNALIETEGGAASISAGSGNFVVTRGTDTVHAGAGPNTVGAIGDTGGLTDAGGGGDLVFVTGGSGLGVQTVLGGSGNETVFAGPKSIDWVGSTPGGSLLFIGGTSASTVLGGGGQETLFGGSGGGVFHMGSHAGNIFVGDAANYAIAAGGGTSAIFGNNGSNITFTGTAGQTGNLLVTGGGSETVDASGSKGNTFVLNTANATIAGSSAGADTFDIFNQGTTGTAHTITITDFVGNGGVIQNLVFIGYGFNPTNTHDGSAIAGPTQAVIGGSDHITLSDNTTIILQGVNSTVSFNNFNAIS